MSAVKKSIEGENPPPRPALPKKEKSEKPLLKAKANIKVPSSAAVEKIRNTVSSASHDQHPGHNVHALGHKVREEVRVTHVYDFVDVNHNGSGIYALAHWAKFLEVHAASVTGFAEDKSIGFIRGLTQR
jgi:hypothetical protein